VLFLQNRSDLAQLKRLLSEAKKETYEAYVRLEKSKPPIFTLTSGPSNGDADHSFLHYNNDDDNNSGNNNTNKTDDVNETHQLTMSEHS